MAEKTMIGLVFVEGYADWEFGFLSGAAVEFFDARVVSLAPGRKPVKSIGGLVLSPERGIDHDENTDLDAVAVIGSETWFSDAPPDIAPLLLAVHVRGGTVGGICAGTLALARAGLFSGRGHTSNGHGWIQGKIGDYDGADQYRDIPFAVSDKRVVSASGTAPGTFAAAFLETLFPAKNDDINTMRHLMAREYGSA
ncbi:glutamine amidotransferase [Phyllobacterium salinisoli]|uniref:Glutamine amidotransferase n=1 Tax=Phyllobacterium salinisoli TaxID=1899321 RepID=A0A368K3R7_9HYPH|nr:DJ-1/PfpI family protein [Phyllobacterium salinisoli]RCS24036.1 glutamine amidotransferase [Phyllobacterium salinisoli]